MGRSGKEFRDSTRERDRQRRDKWDRNGNTQNIPLFDRRDRSNRHEYSNDRRQRPTG